MIKILERFITIFELILLFITISIVVFTLPIWLFLYILTGLNIAEMLVDSDIVNKLL